MRAARKPLFRLTPGGCQNLLTASRRRECRAQFERSDVLRLPGVLAPELLRDMQRKLAGEEFSKFVNGTRARCLVPMGTPQFFLNFLFSGDSFLAAVESVTGCRLAPKVSGRVFKMVSAADHFITWHSDLIEARVLSMTVNLSPRPFKGGRLQLRHVPSGKIDSYEYGEAGDGFLFRLSKDLEHQSTAVTGKNPKIIYTCWFPGEARQGASA